MTCSHLPASWCASAHDSCSTSVRKRSARRCRRTTRSASAWPAFVRWMPSPVVIRPSVSRRRIISLTAGRLTCRRSAMRAWMTSTSSSCSSKMHSQYSSNAGWCSPGVGIVGSLPSGTHSGRGSGARQTAPVTGNRRPVACPRDPRLARTARGARRRRAHRRRRRAGRPRRTERRRQVDTAPGAGRARRPRPRHGRAARRRPPRSVTCTRSCPVTTRRSAPTSDGAPASPPRPASSSWPPPTLAARRRRCRRPVRRGADRWLALGAADLEARDRRGRGTSSASPATSLAQPIRVVVGR